MNLPVNGCILLLGEGDFSFSVAFRRKLPSSSIVATCLLTAEDLYNAHQSSKENVAKLQEAGVEVQFEVDATQLAENENFGNRKFQRVIFNFPHTGGKSNIKKNRKLLRDFFSSVRSILEPGGDVCVTLCQGQGGTPMDKPIRDWPDSWQVVAMAAFSDFVPVNIQPFKTIDYEEYSSTGFRSLDRHFYTEGSVTHFFKYVVSPVVIPEAQALPGAIITDNKNRDFQTLQYVANKYGKNHVNNLQHPIGLVCKALENSLHLQVDNLDIVKDMSPVIQKPVQDTTGAFVYDLNLVEGFHEHKTVDNKYHLRATLFDSLQGISSSMDQRRNTSLDKNSVETGHGSDYMLLCVGDVFRRPVHYNNLDLPVQHEMVGVLTTSNCEPLTSVKNLVTSCVSEVIGESSTQVCITRTTELPAVYEAHFVNKDIFTVELVFNSLNEFYSNACNQVAERGKPDAKRKLTKISKVSREIGYIGKTRNKIGCIDPTSSELNTFVLILDQLAMVIYDIPDARVLWSHRISSQFSSDSICFTPLNYFPPLWRHDLSFWDNDSKEFDESKLHDVIREVAGDLLKSVLLQSVWPEPKMGRISRCYRQVHQSLDLPISHAKAHDFQNAIRLTVAKELGVTLR